MQRLQENNLMFRCLKELLHHLSQCVEGVPSGSEQPSCARRGERLDSVIPRGGGSCRTPSVCLVSPAPRGAGARASPGLQEGDIVRRNILPQVQEAILVHQSSSCVPEPSPAPPQFSPPAPGLHPQRDAWVCNVPAVVSATPLVLSRPLLRRPVALQEDGLQRVFSRLLLVRTHVRARVSVTRVSVPVAAGTGQSRTPPGGQPGQHASCAPELGVDGGPSQHRGAFHTQPQQHSGVRAARQPLFPGAADPRIQGSPLTDALLSLQGTACLPHIFAPTCAPAHRQCLSGLQPSPHHRPR